MRAAVLLAAVAACAPGTPTGSCVFWSDCGEGGACEYASIHPDFADGPNPRFECSFVDESCDSGRAYGEFASDGRRGSCVEHSKGFDGLCDGQCNEGLYCELGRCLSVRQLDATGRIVAALCANDNRPGNGGDVYAWGIAFPFAGTTLFLPGAVADAAPYATPNAHFEATGLSIGEAHLCLTGNNEAAERDSECFGNPVVNRAVTTLPAIMGAWAFETPGVFTNIAAGKGHTCATIGRNVTCWGDNTHGQLDGLGTAVDVFTNGLGSSEIITHLSVGATFSCAGTLANVWCWGNAQNWAMETFVDPTMTGMVQPVVGVSEGEVTSLDAGEAHVCAVKGGLLWCWGANESGQTTGEASSLPEPPARPLGDTPVLAVAAGRQHTCAVTTANQVMCWGGNAQNQLGSPTAATTPIAVPLAGRAILIAAGDDVTCALLEDSWVTCWGAPELTTDTGAFTPGGDPILLDHFPLLCDTF